MTVLHASSNDQVFLQNDAISIIAKRPAVGCNSAHLSWCSNTTTQLSRLPSVTWLTKLFRLMLPSDPNVGLWAASFSCLRRSFLQLHAAQIRSISAHPKGQQRYGLLKEGITSEGKVAAS